MAEFKLYNNKTEQEMYEGYAGDWKSLGSAMQRGTPCPFALHHASLPACVGAFNSEASWITTSNQIYARLSLLAQQHSQQCCYGRASFSAALGPRNSRCCVPLQSSALPIVLYSSSGA